VILTQDSLKDFIEVEPVAPPSKVNADDILIKDIARLAPTHMASTKRTISDVQIIETQTASVKPSTSAAANSQSSSQSTISAKLAANLLQLQEDEELARALAESEETDTAELAEYASLLEQQTNQLVRERQNADRLSHSIEQHVIDDAKACLHSLSFS
jgi:hypothetical protein